MAARKKKELPWPADQVERRSVASLVPYARNARTHSEEQVKQIAASIKEWGWTTPVLIDEEGTIIAGHGRVMAAHRLKVPEVPVMVARGWSDAQKRAYALADNKLPLNAGWDNDLLKLELGELQALNFDLSLTGFSPSELPHLSSAAGTVGIESPPASNYNEQYGVIVVCRDEDHQRAVYEDLRAAGHSVKVVVT